MSSQPQPASESAPEPVAPAAPASDATPKPQGPADVLKIEGIIWTPENPLAIINGETVSVGGAVKNYRVAAITKTTIEVEGPNNTRHTLEF
jgi:hypothetical protein